MSTKNKNSSSDDDAKPAAAALPNPPPRPWSSDGGGEQSPTPFRKRTTRSSMKLRSTQDPPSLPRAVAPRTLPLRTNALSPRATAAPLFYRRHPCPTRATNCPTSETAPVRPTSSKSRRLVDFAPHHHMGRSCVRRCHRQRLQRIASRRLPHRTPQPPSQTRPRPITPNPRWLTQRLDARSRVPVHARLAIQT